MRRSFFHLTIMHTPSLYDYTFPYLVHTYLLLDSPLLLTYDCLQLPSVYICITFEKCHVKKSLVCIAFCFFVCIIHFLNSMNASLVTKNLKMAHGKNVFYSSLAKLKSFCMAFFRISCCMVRKTILFTVSPWTFHK